ncbi:MAG: CoA pyrophosphatase [Myxococcales bacterium]|nr:CoA pyrophosphatase [Myxococcales bacterium]
MSHLVANRGAPWLDPIRSRLQRFERHTIENPELRPAAVAFTLVKEAAGPAFILTQRARELSHHPGQFALPGGRMDPGETPMLAARRELAEEVGLQLSGEQVLGCLDDFETRSGFRMTPVVLWGGEAPALTAAPAEVGAIHRIPLAMLERDDLIDLWPIPESDRPVLSMRLGELRIFAPTAALIYQFREVALFDRETRVAHYEQPVFAWS